MSDFLTHLAARSLAPPTLRPRTLSRFEAEAPAEAPENEEPQPVARAQVRTTTARPAIAAPTPAPAVTQQEVIREHTHDVVHEASTTHIVERREEVLRAEARSETTQRPMHEEQPRTARRETSGDETHPALPPRRQQRVPDANADQRGRPAFNPLLRGEAASRPALPQAREASIPRESEPIIHVSIGRVEVRATTSAAPPRTGRRNAMTIDDYVARKNAKGRP